MSNTYKIIRAGTIKDLEDLVNTEIDNYYTIVGSMTCEIYQGYPPIYYQTMLQSVDISKVFNLPQPVVNIPTVWNEPTPESTKTKRKYTKNENT